MLALSIRQPWAWLILNAGKDIESRDWPTRVRGRVLIHASKGMSRDEYEDGIGFAQAVAHEAGRVLRAPTIEEITRGGIVGSVEIVDCVQRHPSRWFFGRYGFVLRDPQVLPFQPLKGRLGFFEVPRA